jgi:hypothetical protein
LKNSFAEHHADVVAAAMLKRARAASGFLFATQKDKTKPSRTTARVPASAPYKSTAVNVNASETEIETWAQGK